MDHRFSAVGTREIPKKGRFGGAVAGVRTEFLFDGGEGAEKQAGDIGDDGGAARGDAVLGEEDEELGEDLVDVGGGGKLAEIAGEVGGEVGRVGGWRPKVDVVFAEIGRGVREGEAAATAAGVAVQTAGETLRRAQCKQVASGTGVSGFLSHGSLFGEGRGTPHPGLICASVRKERGCGRRVKRERGKDRKQRR